MTIGPSREALHTVFKRTVWHTDGLNLLVLLTTTGIC